ncbi:hypothetical protein Tco_1353552 [Tanacetum coccineum]
MLGVDTDEEIDDEQDDIKMIQIWISLLMMIREMMMMQHDLEYSCITDYTDAHTTSAVANLEGNPKEMFPDNADHQVSSPLETTTHDIVTNSQQNTLQAKAKKLMAKAKHNIHKISFKKAVEQKFKEYDQKLEALTSINVSEAIEDAVQAKVLTEMKKQLPTYVQ